MIMQLSPDFFFFFSKHIDSPNCNLQGKERELEMKVFILSQKATPTTKTMNQPNSNPNNQKPQTKKQPQTNEKKNNEKGVLSTQRRLQAQDTTCSFVPILTGPSRWKIISKQFSTARLFKPLGSRLHGKRYEWKRLLNIFCNHKLKTRTKGESGCSLDLP